MKSMNNITENIFFLYNSHIRFHRISVRRQQKKRRVNKKGEDRRVLVKIKREINVFKKNRLIKKNRRDIKLK